MRRRGPDPAALSLLSVDKVVDRRWRIAPSRGLAWLATRCLFNRQVGAAAAPILGARARPCHHGGRDAFILDPTRVRDLSGRLLDDRARLRVVPVRELATTTPEERLLFGVRHGLYGFPTQELVDFLRVRIAGRSAIEIGAGHGVLAQALGIPATDNRQQEDEDIQACYRALGQPTVP